MVTKPLSFSGGQRHLIEDAAGRRRSEVPTRSSNMAVSGPSFIGSRLPSLP